MHVGGFGLDAAHADFPETDAEEDGEGNYDEEGDEDGGVALHCGGWVELLWCGGVGEWTGRGWRIGLLQGVVERELLFRRGV